MSTMIEICNVPDELHCQIAARPSLDELRARLERYAEVNLSVAPAEAIREERGDF